ncbi:hypothetical protein VaNZ11_009030 [Volvox africanus]|uniref:non-specific serine/threonine protein kinase n=1 Tax=Volvox africanus TaxID=51714 RepID=A0ABQ5S7S4_9CHLO|nr:hypothetical protein VaNZ11_009030 [Volvox africanus]
MKKLFDKVGKKRDSNSLVGKVVLVGQYSVKVEALIGEGGFATIYRCVDMKSGHTFALKHMRLGADADAIKEVQREAKTMARLKGHPNILKLHAVAFAGPVGAETDGFMLLDFCPQTLLEAMQRSSFNLDDFLVYEVFQDVVWAVAHMHKCNPPLAHRDLKAENVLKNGEGRWVICDFGSSTARAQVYDTPAEIAVEEENIRRTTTPAYRAPEMWDLYARQRIDTAVDVWALGVLLYVLAFGKLPFQGDSKLSILYGKYDMPPGRPAAMRSLIQDMLQVNPKDRPDIFQVISKLDILRNALSCDPTDSLPSQPLSVPPPVQQQSQQPAGAYAHPQAHPQPHAQQQRQQSVPGPDVGATTQSYPNHHGLAVQPQGSYSGQSEAQQHRAHSPTANGQPSSWTNGSAAPYNTPQMPVHPQPQLQSHTLTHAHPQPQAQPPQPQYHQPHPSPYRTPQHGQQHQPSQSQPGQPQLYAPSSGASHTGPGPGPGSATVAAAASPTQLRTAAVAPPAQRIPSRQSSFNPQWPATTAPARQQQSVQQPAAGPVLPASQLVNLMDAAMAEPVPSATAASGPDWELGFHSGSGAGRGSGNAAALHSTPQDVMTTVASAAFTSPASAAHTPSVQLHQHKRTGSSSEPGRLHSASPMATAGAAAVHATMGFGDDNVDWGEHPAFAWSASHQQLQQSNSQLLRMESMSGSMGPSGAGGAGGDGGGSASAASPAMPLAPQAAGYLHSTSNSASSQRSPLSMSAVAALPSGIVRPVSVAAAAPPPPPQPQQAWSVGSSVVAGQIVSTSEAAGTAMARSASSVIQRAGSFELVPGGSAEVESLRAQLQDVTAANSQLEGRVQQLEGIVASQDAMIQRLASELRALILHQQQPQQQSSLSLPSPQKQQQPVQSKLQQQQQQHGATISQQPVGLSGCNINGSDGGGGGGPSTGLLRSVAPGSATQMPARGDASAGTGVDAGGGNAGSGDGILGDCGGDNGGRGGGAVVLPGSQARAAATHNFEPETWSIIGEQSTSGTAIYPPIRYEDLA